MRTCTAWRSRSALPDGTTSARTSRSTSGRSPAARSTEPCSTRCPPASYTLWLDDQPLRRLVAVAGAAVTDISIKEEHE
jgi:hypothetical protein